MKNPKSNALARKIQHTHYDRSTGKFVRTMVEESEEHKKMSKSLVKKTKAPTLKEQIDYQRRTGRGYHE